MLKLHGFSVSNYYNMVKLALLEKGLPFEEVTFYGGQAPQALEVSPRGKVPVLHWHGDRFDIPAGATRLAGTPSCANQAFSVGRHVLALQCPLEADPRQIERWPVGHACELAQAGIDPRALRTDAQALQSSLPLAARAAFTAWLDEIEAACPREAP